MVANVQVDPQHRPIVAPYMLSLRPKGIMYLLCQPVPDNSYGRWLLPKDPRLNFITAWSRSQCRNQGSVGSSLSVVQYCPFAGNIASPRPLPVC